MWESTAWFKIGLQLRLQPRWKSAKSDREIYLRTSEREESLSSDLKGRTAAGLGEGGRIGVSYRDGEKGFFCFVFFKGKKESLSENRQQIGGGAGEEREELTGKSM